MASSSVMRASPGVAHRRAVPLVDGTVRYDPRAIAARAHVARAIERPWGLPLRRAGLDI